MQKLTHKTVQDYISEAEAWDEQERHKKAIESYEKALTLLDHASTKEDLILRGECNQAMGTLWRLLGKHKYTGDYYQKAVQDFQTAYDGKPHLKLGEMYYLLGSFLEQIWRLKPAKIYYQQALEQLVVCLGEDHPNTCKVREKLHHKN